MPMAMTRPVLNTALPLVWLAATYCDRAVWMEPAQDSETNAEYGVPYCKSPVLGADGPGHEIFGRRIPRILHMEKPGGGQSRVPVIKAIFLVTSACQTGEDAVNE